MWYPECFKGPEEEPWTTLPLQAPAAFQYGYSHLHRGSDKALLPELRMYTGSERCRRSN